MALHLKSTGLDFTDFSDLGTGPTAMVSELMDDYEEGTFVAAPGQGDVTLSQEQCYTKMGDIVDTRGYAYNNAHTTDTYDWGLSGFPFAARVTCYGVGQYHNLDAIPTIANIQTVTLFIDTNESAMEGHYSVQDTPWVRLKYPEMGTTFHVGWTFTYFSQSDFRLKDNIILLQKATSILPNIYMFKYKWDKFTNYVGVMAQELLDTGYSDAVGTDSEGFYNVNYSRLGFPMMKISKDHKFK